MQVTFNVSIQRLQSVRLNCPHKNSTVANSGWTLCNMCDAASLSVPAALFFWLAKIWTGHKCFLCCTCF